MKILLAQNAPVVGDIERNLATLESMVTNIDVNLLIFPELFISGYVPRDRVVSIADAIDGPSVLRIREICRESAKAVIVGLPLKHPTISGQITNSAIIVDQGGRISRYDKTYLPTFGSFEESLYFSPGYGTSTADISGVKVGVMICYDIFFPELSKLLALSGTDLLVCISAAPTSTVENFLKVIPARAIENAAYVAYVNCVGSHLNLVFGGLSRLVDPRGELVIGAKPLEEDRCIGEIDLSKVELARRMRPTLRNSRREVIEAILEKLKFE